MDGKFCVKLSFRCGAAPMNCASLWMLWVLRRLHAPLPKGGALRLAVPEDEEVAAPWIAAFQQEAGHRELPLEMAREKFQKRVEKGTLYLFETRAGTPVFMATGQPFFAPWKVYQRRVYRAGFPRPGGTAKRRWPCYASVSWARGMSMSLYSWTKQTRFPTGRIRKSVLRLWKIIATTG